MSILLNNISKSFGLTVACNGISLAINQGEFFFVLGPSGCGKSTLLKIIAGLLQQDSGDVKFDEILFNEIPAYERPFNTIFQNYSLFPHLSVFNNIGFGLKMNNTPKAEIKLKVNEVLSLFQISELAERKPDQLSGGQQQRVALARAIVNQPKILLLDEPLSALDEKLRLDMQQILKELKSKLNTTFIYVTHNQEEALSMGDRIAIMNNGKIEQVGTPRGIYYNPSSRFIAEFIGEVNILKYKTFYKDNGIENTDIKFDEKQFNIFNPIGLIKKEIDLIRPENIIIDKKELDHIKYSEIIKGIVTQRLFKGNTTTYIVKCNDGRTIKATGFNTSFAEDIEIGNEVFTGWQNQFVKTFEI